MQHLWEGGNVPRPVPRHNRQWGHEDHLHSGRGGTDRCARGRHLEESLLGVDTPLGGLPNHLVLVGRTAGVMLDLARGVDEDLCARGVAQEAGRTHAGLLTKKCGHDDLLSP